MADEKPWCAPGHRNSLPGTASTSRPRERLWTLIKRGKRVDAELLLTCDIDTARNRASSIRAQS